MGQPTHRWVRYFSLALTLGSAAGTAHADAPLAQGPGFSIPIPAGYQKLPIDADATAQNIVVTLAGERSTYRLLIAVQTSGVPGTVFTQAQCEESTRRLASRLGSAGPTTSRLVQQSWGPTCESTVAGTEGAAKGRIRATVVYRGARVWNVVCSTFLLRGATTAPQADAECDQVLAGWRFR